MPPSSSSTSNSEPTSPAQREARIGLRVFGRRRRVVMTCAWTLLMLALLDVGLGLAFRYPTSNADQPTALQIYFDYGRSIEAKLKRMLAETELEADPVAVAGWPGRIVRDIDAPAEAGQIGCTFYGMSFTDRVGQAAAKLDDSIVPDYISGPAAPPNHSYACFLAERGRDKNPVQVWGILASSVPAMLTLTGATTTFERPSPFTFPRYVVGGDGTLQEIQPLIRGPSQMRKALRQPARWHAFTDQLAAHDRFYDPWQMHANALLDASTTFRFLRRAYAQHEKRTRLDAIYDSGGFADDPEIGPVLDRMIKNFGEQCRAAGQVPIVLLIQDRGAKDALFRLVQPMLEAHGVPYLSTHQIVDPTNPLNFESDGHFIPEQDSAVAQRLVELIRTQMKEQPVSK